MYACSDNADYLSPIFLCLQVFVGIQVIVLTLVSLLKFPLENSKPNEILQLQR